MREIDKGGGEGPLGAGASCMYAVRIQGGVTEIHVEEAKITLSLKGVMTMAHAERCPVCTGIGTVEIPDFYNNNSSSMTLPKSRKTCHGCDGKGWVTVGTEYPPNPQGVYGSADKEFREKR